MGNGSSDRKADTQELMQIRQEAYEAASQLLAAAHPKKGSILVVGCSTSEVAGERIGSFSSPELGQALFDGVYQAAKEAEVFLAAQCCEHLNRSIDRKSTRLNSSHRCISYAVFCLKKDYLSSIAR